MTVFLDTVGLLALWDESDQWSFVVMHRLGLSQAFTNDRHFRAAGFAPMF